MKTLSVVSSSSERRPLNEKRSRKNAMLSSDSESEGEHMPPIKKIRREVGEQQEPETPKRNVRRGRRSRQTKKESPIVEKISTVKSEIEVKHEIIDDTYNENEDIASPYVGLSDYEIQIQKNLEARAKFMNSLDIFAAKENLLELSPKPVKRESRGIARERKTPPEPQEIRRSLRQRNMTPDGSDLPLPSDKEVAQSENRYVEDKPRPPPGPAPLMDYYEKSHKEECEETLSGISNISKSSGENSVWSGSMTSCVSTLAQFRSKPAQKSTRKTFSIKTKKLVLELKDEGKSNSAIGRQLNIAESTVRGILKNKEQILKMCDSYGSSSLDSRSYASTYNKELIEMENLLMLWISKKEGKGVGLDNKTIIGQAKIFYTLICKKNNVSPFGFKASTGWLYRFLERKGICKHNMNGKKSSLDEVATKEFTSILKEMIEDGGYHPDAIYDMAETGLQYKRMPKSIFLAKRTQGRNADKSRFTVLFCVNSTGTHKMRPLVVHAAKHPQCSNHLSDMKDASVYWRSSKKSCITSTISQDWLLNCFVPDARRKCLQDGREFKVILTQDNCQAHPSILNGLHPNVRVVFLPPNTTSLLKPLSQEIITCVKAFYHQTVFRDFRRCTESKIELQQMIGNDSDVDEPMEEEENEDFLIVHQYWRKYTVKRAIDHLMAAWENINVATLRHGWLKLAPYLVSSKASAQPIQRSSDILSAAVQEARLIQGFGDVAEDELLEMHADGEAASEEDIMNAASVESTLQQEHQQQPVDEDAAPKDLSLHQVSSILAAVENLKSVIAEHEICEVRKAEMVEKTNQVFKFYSDLHIQKQNKLRQALITKFVRPNRSEDEHDPAIPKTSSDSESITSVEELFKDDEIEEFEGFLPEDG
ncbi:tigger transposable element-derived protein 1-like isoform X1 [Palaemon carinicauda]|uniref:tigger transposable element-derived protein 1-like isoform X1 n=1 Tax=Palaemon carinicauda TaxID=392227 RepID=UPI0035B623F5